MVFYRRWWSIQLLDSLWSSWCTLTLSKIHLLVTAANHIQIKVIEDLKMVAPSEAWQCRVVSYTIFKRKSKMASNFYFIQWETLINIVLIWLKEDSMMVGAYETLIQRPKSRQYVWLVHQIMMEPTKHSRWIKPSPSELISTSILTSILKILKSSPVSTFLTAR